MYGQRFVREYGEKPSYPWLQMLDELTDDDCAVAFDRIRKASPKFPPNVGEFGEFAGKGGGVRYLGVPETADEKQRRIGHVQASPEVRDRALADIRARIGRGPEPEPEPEPAEVKPRNPILEHGCTCAPDGTGAACACCVEWQRVMREGAT